MKKLMIAACAVAFAAAAQAATFTWATGSNAMGPDVTLTSLTAGHVDSGSTTMKAMSDVTWTYVMALTDGSNSDNLSGAITYSMNKISVTGLSADSMWKPASATDPVNTVDYSIVITGTYKDANGVDWTFTSDAIASSVDFASTSTLQLKTAGASGWTITSSAAPIPEPTSGLLLLLGVAGLALRRRRA